MPNSTPIEFDYEIVRSVRRKTMAIEVKRGSVRVMAPAWLATSQITRFVDTKRHWIGQKLQLQRQQRQQLTVKISRDCSLNLFGQTYRVNIVLGAQFAVARDDELHLLTITIPRRVKQDNVNLYVLKKLQTWLGQELAAYSEQFIQRHRNELVRVPRVIDFKRYKAKWGSCNRRDEIYLNWRLALLAPWLIDYVIYHECAHLVHFDHSNGFWLLVAQYCHDYRNAEKQLKAMSGLELEVDLLY